MTELLILIFSTLGSLITYYWSARYKQSPVLTSACSSLVVSLLLFLVFGSVHEAASKLLSLAFFGGSFVGMSAEIVIKKKKYAALSGFIFGVVYLISIPLFIGFGGGLGFRAMFSVFMTLGIQVMEEKLTSWRFVSRKQ